jgi:hypothetical protein
MIRVGQILELIKLTLFSKTYLVCGPPPSSKTEGYWPAKHSSNGLDQLQKI